MTSALDGVYCVAAVGPLPGEPRTIRAARYADLLRVLALTDPVPAAFRTPLATAWRALAEGVPRVFVAPSALDLAHLEEPLVVAGATAMPPESPPQAGPRLYLFDPPTARGAPGDLPTGLVGLWPWVSLVLPGLSGPVDVPPSVFAAGLFAQGRASSTYAADPVGSGPPPGEGWVRLSPAGRRRLLHLEPAPPRPGGAFPVEDADETQLEMLWAEAQASPQPVEALTRALHARYGAGVRVFLEDAGLRVQFPPPADVRALRGVTLRFTPRR